MSQTTKISEIMLYYKPKKQTRAKVTSSKDAYKYLLPYFRKEILALQEQFVVLYLNRANEVLGGYLCSLGGITGTIADVRLILGLKSGACNIILSHNHPSGNMNASSSDRQLTEKMNAACKVMDINLLDHIIISPKEFEFMSFADEGLL
jgi:DNA repair protein RadC